MEKTVWSEGLLKAFSRLTPREQKVIMLRYGVDDGYPRTLEEVGKEFGVSRERIRQIESVALNKMKAFGVDVAHQKLDLNIVVEEMKTELEEDKSENEFSSLFDFDDDF